MLLFLLNLSAPHIYFSILLESTVSMLTVVSSTRPGGLFKHICIYLALVSFNISAVLLKFVGSSQDVFISTLSVVF